MNQLGSYDTVRTGSPHIEKNVERHQRHRRHLVVILVLPLWELFQHPLGRGNVMKGRAEQPRQRGELRLEAEEHRGLRIAN